MFFSCLLFSLLQAALQSVAPSLAHADDLGFQKEMAKRLDQRWIVPGQTVLDFQSLQFLVNWVSKDPVNKRLIEGVLEKTKSKNLHDFYTRGYIRFCPAASAESEAAGIVQYGLTHHPKKVTVDIAVNSRELYEITQSQKTQSDFNTDQLMAALYLRKVKNHLSQLIERRSSSLSEDFLIYKQQTTTEDLEAKIHLYRSFAEFEYLEMRKNFDPASVEVAQNNKTFTGDTICLSSQMNWLRAYRTLVHEFTHYLDVDEYESFAATGFDREQEYLIHLLGQKGNEVDAFIAENEALIRLAMNMDQSDLMSWVDVRVRRFFDFSKARFIGDRAAFAQLILRDKNGYGYASDILKGEYQHQLSQEKDNAIRMIQFLSSSAKVYRRLNAQIDQVNGWNFQSPSSVIVNGLPISSFATLMMWKKLNAMQLNWLDRDIQDFTKKAQVAQQLLDQFAEE